MFNYLRRTAAGKIQIFLPSTSRSCHVQCNPMKSLVPRVTSNLDNLRLDSAALGRCVHEPVHDLRVAGEYQHLVRFGEFDE